MVRACCLYTQLFHVYEYSQEKGKQLTVIPSTSVVGAVQKTKILKEAPMGVLKQLLETAILTSS